MAENDQNLQIPRWSPHPDPDTSDQAADDCLVLGEDLLRAGSREQAQTCFTELFEGYAPYLLEREPVEGRARLRAMAVRVAIACAGTSEHRAVDGLPWARRAIRYEPENPRTYELLGDLHVSLDQGEEAVRAFEKALECLGRLESPDPADEEQLRSRLRSIRSQSGRDLPGDGRKRNPGSVGAKLVIWTWIGGLVIWGGWALSGLLLLWGGRASLPSATYSDSNAVIFDYMIYFFCFCIYIAVPGAVYFCLLGFVTVVASWIDNWKQGSSRQAD